jgi:hypothetical protein
VTTAFERVLPDSPTILAARKVTQIKKDSPAIQAAFAKLASQKRFQTSNSVNIKFSY